MGHYARIPPEFGDLTEFDAAALAHVGLIAEPDPTTPRSGYVSRNGRVTAFTLDTTHMAPELHRIMPEQFAIAALLLASFVMPLWHLFG